MQLSENQIFDGRYLLVELIGRGASAEVWKAVDTKAGNMPVAIKIYKPDTINAGSAGIAEFQREFTMVYNMTHANLLHPQNFDIVEGSPYLVMAFCENGSTTSMIGRFEEDDILRFLRDVSAGLEYLHDHNIVHQDIKPDNILIDDNCNYLVTDFGISRRDAGADDAIGGTRAYMAPEVYKRNPVAASDIWSLGATAVELLNGEPPYGELGGAGQLQSGAAPEVKGKVSAPVKKLITDMLNPDPRKRPSAASVRSQIDHFRETGSWNRNVQRNKIAYIAAGIASLLVCAGLFFWDINRTKVRYYKDYNEIWGVPEGIAPISAYTAAHREISYKFEYKGGKLRHLTRVNQFDNPVTPGETEYGRKLLEAEYFYTNDGKVDYVKVYNQGGECTYVMDYDSNLKTAILKSDDEYGTEKPLPGKTTETANALQDQQPKPSPITRYKFTYDERGRYKRVEYATYQNVDVTDDDMVHGMDMEYNDDNQVVKLTFIDLDGNPRGNSRGLAEKRYEYDNDNNWIALEYRTVDGQPSSDGNFVPRFTHSYDKWGNILDEKYFDLDGNPMIRPDLAASEIRYTLNDIGQTVERQLFGLDGEPAYSKQGFSINRMEYDENGYLSKLSNHDADGELVNIIEENFGVYSVQKLKNNGRGLTTEISVYDRDEEPVEVNNGLHKFGFDYDEKGHMTERRFYNKSGKPFNLQGFTASEKYVYNDLGQNTEIGYYNADNKLANGSEGYAREVYKYNLAGSPTQIEYFDEKGKKVLVKSGFAEIRYSYDQRGNQISTELFDTEGKPVVGSWGWQKVVDTFDEATNYNTARTWYDAAGKMTNKEVYRHDDHGNLIEIRQLDASGNLKSGSGVEHREYDSNGREIRNWYTNASNVRTNMSGESYCETRTKYDKFGNKQEISYWSVDNKPAGDSNKVHRIVSEYNKLNQLVREVYYGTDGNPIKSTDSSAPEIRYEYDAKGNNTVVILMDGRGNAINHPQGWHKRTRKYDNQNRVIDEAYTDKDGKPVMNTNLEGARATSEYDKHGNQTKVVVYDTSNKPVLIYTYKYNDRDKLIEQVITDGNGKYTEDRFSKITWEYEADGVRGKRLSYYFKGKLYAWALWNKDKNDWDYDNIHYEGGAPAQSMNYSAAASAGSDWQQEFREAAASCPMDMGNDVTMQSISVSSSSVTLTFRFREMSIYSITADERALVKTFADTLYDNFRGEVPGYVSIRIVCQDKAGRRIEY